MTLLSSVSLDINVKPACAQCTLKENGEGYIPSFLEVTQGRK